MMHIVCYLRTGSKVLRDLLDDAARRRGDGQQLRVARLNRLRAARDLGGFAGRLATTVGSQRRTVADQWTSHRPMARLNAGYSDDLAIG
ncbi:MAG TPA: hypothetical protein VFG71_07680 [Nitrospiraceae bacterium]|nr:hypothetical protein [Nitrospiraceae bacterium]